MKSNKNIQTSKIFQLLRTYLAIDNNIRLQQNESSPLSHLN